MTMKQFAQEHPKILQKFLRAFDKANAFIRKEREKSIEITATRLGLNRDSVGMALDDFVFGISLDQSLLVGWDDIASWAIENKFTDKTKFPNYLNYICLEALKAVKPKSITIIR